MSAHKSGTHAGNTKARNQKMAADMARNGVKRSTMRDPITHNLISIDSFFARIGRGGGNDRPRIKG